MFIEVLHDSNGNIMACYCADTLPIQSSLPLVRYEQIPSGCEQARINIDTVTAMEVEAGSGDKAAIDPSTQQPVLVHIDRAEYIMNNFKADLTLDIAPPQGISLPFGMKIRGLERKA